MMKKEDAKQKPDIRDAINSKRPQRVSNRGRALVEESDQQHRRESHEFPSGDQKIDRPGREGEFRTEREQVKQQEKSEKTAVTVQIPRREGADQPRDMTERPSSGNDSESTSNCSGNLYSPAENQSPKSTTIGDHWLLLISKASSKTAMVEETNAPDVIRTVVRSPICKPASHPRLRSRNTRSGAARMNASNISGVSMIFFFDPMNYRPTADPVILARGRCSRLPRYQSADERASGSFGVHGALASKTPSR